MHSSLDNIHLSFNPTRGCDLCGSSMCVLPRGWFRSQLRASRSPIVKQRRFVSKCFSSRASNPKNYSSDDFHHRYSCLSERCICLNIEVFDPQFADSRSTFHTLIIQDLFPDKVLSNQLTAAFLTMFCQIRAHECSIRSSPFCTHREGCCTFTSADSVP